MSGVCPYRESNENNKLMEELRRGRDSAIELQALLSEASGVDKAFRADKMLEKILRSFSESISVMSSCESAEVIDGVMTGDSGESKKRPGSKEARGCYKRRSGSQSRMIVASTVEDGHAWRKYGQKDILNSKFPRCYYRCTHKYDQGCKATRQVQKTEDNPNMYRITYHGQHTCREITSAPQMIPDSDPWESNVPGPNNPFPCVEDERKDDSASDLTDCISGINRGFPDLPGFGSSAEPTTDCSLWSFLDDGVRDFPDADFMWRCNNFDGDFQFPGSELL